MMDEDVAVGTGHFEVLLLAIAVVLVGFRGVKDGFDGVVLKTVVPCCFVFDIDMGEGLPVGGDVERFVVGSLDRKDESEFCSIGECIPEWMKLDDI